MNCDLPNDAKLQRVTLCIDSIGSMKPQLPHTGFHRHNSWAARPCGLFGYWSQTVILKAAQALLNIVERRTV
eukprot:4968302-Amphidinium_carterae.1